LCEVAKRQTNNDKNIYSLAEVITPQLHKTYYASSVEVLHYLW